MTSAFERHAAQDAPTKAEFKGLLAAASRSDDCQRRIEDQFIVFGAGRLGFRSGELLHFHSSWVDRQEKIIRIPNHDSCSCRYCRERAEALADDHDDVEFEEALKFYWKPKYPASVRAIPYGFSDQAIEVVETFLDEVGNLDVAQSTINRRVTALQERAGVGGRLYPHALRAAAAFHWAQKGLEALYLQALMGWEDMRIANRYIRATGRQLDNRLNQLASTGSDSSCEDSVEIAPENLPDPTDAVYNAVDNGNPRSPNETEYLHETDTDPVDDTLSGDNDSELTPTTLTEFNSTTSHA